MWLKLIRYSLRIALLLSIPTSYAAKPIPSTDIRKVEQQLKELAEAEKKHREWAIELQNTLDALRQQQVDTQLALRSQAQQLSRTFGAFRCLSANSPATFLATLHNQDDFVHTSLLLRRLMPYLQKVGQSLKQELAELANVRIQIMETEGALQKAAKKLQQQHKELTSTLTKLRDRQTLDTALAAAFNIPLNETATLVTNTQNRVQDISASFVRPVEGIIIKAFGQHEPYSGRGVVFQGIAQEEVCAPAQGRVTAVLPTPRGYRVVVQHAKGYQTILEGLEQVTSKPGEVVAANDILGQLPNPVLGQPELYCEIQRFHQSINPGLVFKTK